MTDVPAWTIVSPSQLGFGPGGALVEEICARIGRASPGLAPRSARSPHRRTGRSLKPDPRGRRGRTPASCRRSRSGVARTSWTVHLAQGRRTQASASGRVFRSAASAARPAGRWARCRCSWDGIVSHPPVRGPTITTCPSRRFGFPYGRVGFRRLLGPPQASRADRSGAVALGAPPWHGGGSGV